jgi:hypothetical protein
VAFGNGIGMLKAQSEVGIVEGVIEKQLKGWAVIQP